MMARQTEARLLPGGDGCCLGRATQPAAIFVKPPYAAARWV